MGIVGQRTCGIISHMENFKENWNKQHHKYAEAEWINKPTLFALSMTEYLPATGKVLDIGCGQGQDSTFFAEHGLEVIGSDLSSEGINYAKQRLPEELKERVVFVEGDVSKPLPYENESLDIVYSHLALHYFDKETTQRIFDEIYRVLKPGGKIIVLMNSVNDPEYGEGEKIEDDYYHIGNMYKRFFSSETIKEFTNKFEVIVDDEAGETYKDKAVGVGHLVRFVGKKVE